MHLENVPIQSCLMTQFLAFWVNTSPLTDLQGLPPKFFNKMSPKVSVPSLRSLFSKQEQWRPSEIGGQYALFGHHCPVAFCYLNFAAVFCLHSVSQFVNQPIGRTNFVYDLSFCWRFAIFFLTNTETYSLLIPDMDTYSQSFQFSAKSFLAATIAIL